MLEERLGWGPYLAITSIHFSDELCNVGSRHGTVCRDFDDIESAKPFNVFVAGPLRIRRVNEETDGGRDETYDNPNDDPRQP